MFVRWARGKGGRGASGVRCLGLMSRREKEFLKNVWNQKYQKVPTNTKSIKEYKKYHQTGDSMFVS